MFVELPKFVAECYPFPLWSARRTFRAAVCGVCVAAAPLLIAGTARAQEKPAGWTGLKGLDRSKSGAVVGSVFPDSPGEKAGIVAGDTIISFNGIDAAEDLKGDSWRKLMTTGQQITLRLRHNGVRTAKVAVETLPEFPRVGKPAPQIAVQQWLNAPTGETLGKTTTFGDGHVYVLDFTATWCVACPSTYPIMDKLREKYAAQGLRVIYVTALWGFDKEGDITDDDKHSKELGTLSQYVTYHHLSSPVAVMASYDQFASNGYFYGVALPRVVLVDGAGKVRDMGDIDNGQFAAVDSAIAASHSKTP